jgi:hypothetical protein
MVMTHEEMMAKLHAMRDDPFFPKPYQEPSEEEVLAIRDEYFAQKRAFLEEMRKASAAEYR